MIKTLNELKIESQGIIKKVNGDGQIRRRLFDMGVTVGADIEVIKKAPLGDPIEIKIRGYSLSIRKNEASLVEVYITKEN